VRRLLLTGVRLCDGLGVVTRARLRPDSTYRSSSAPVGTCGIRWEFAELPFLTKPFEPHHVDTLIVRIKRVFGV